MTFEVTRGDGRLNDPGDNLRKVTLLTDGGGNASVGFTLGSRTGEGFHRVKVTTPGSLAFTEFCATAETSEPVNIAVLMAPPGQSLAGQALSNPIGAIVTDAGGNPVKSVGVTFAVEAGGGDFGGSPSVVVLTDADGIAEAGWTLGPEAGVANNEASATFAGNPGSAAVYIVSGVVAGVVAETTVSGVVQDSTGAAIVGAEATLRGTGLSSVTGEDGRFRITGVSPGGHLVVVHGSAADDAEAGIFFPDIEFAIEVFPGVDNALDQIVVLPFLDQASAREVGGDEDVTLTMAGVPGFGITVFARSTWVHDPVTGELVQEPVVMSSSQVKFDKVPMPPPQGSTPLIVGTLQPPGVFLDPPARVCYPNAEGLAPGDVADIFAFHHDIGQFVNIGPGTVTEDGSVVCSDPGFGIVQSGWHCLIRLPGPAAQCANGCTATATWMITKNGTGGGTISPGAGSMQPVVLEFVDDPDKIQEAEITVRSCREWDPLGSDGRSQ